jgi:hypothetical protein
MNKTKRVSHPNATLIITLIILVILILAVTPLGNFIVPFITSTAGRIIMSLLLLIWFGLSFITDYKHWSEYSKGRKFFVMRYFRSSNAMY